MIEELCHVTSVVQVFMHVPAPSILGVGMLSIWIKLGAFFNFLAFFVFIIQ
jgi:hypothetical protein